LKIIQMMHTIVTKTDCFGNDSFYVMCYALRIMHYEFIQTRTSYETHDRASLREGVLSDVWNFPTIMHYELSRHACPYDTHDRASLREGVLSDAWISLQLCIMNYAL